MVASYEFRRWQADFDSGRPFKPAKLRFNLVDYNAP